MSEALEFPSNIVLLLDDVVRAAMPDYEVAKRPLRLMDPAKSIGIFLVDWQPVVGTEEMGNSFGPTLNTYLLRLQVLVKHGDEAEGRVMFTTAAKKLRTMLARDPDLRVRLAALSEVELAAKETVRRFGVRNQRFLNNELRGAFVYMATTDFFVETETIQVP